MPVTYFANEILGEKRRIAPDGTLICLDVPVSRTGLQIYHAGDGLPVEPGPEGYIKVERDPEDVFEQEALASLEGKTITNEHPHDGVDANNWRLLSMGHAQNVRRGEGVLDNVVLADLHIKDPHLIREINEGRKRQISVGYDADYETLGPGHARQRKIRANHIAVVSSARCGPLCSIGDSDVAHPSVIARPRRRPVHIHLHV